MQTEMKNHSFYEQRGVGVRWAYEARCHDFTLPKKCLAKKKRAEFGQEGGENS